MNIKQELGFIWTGLKYIIAVVACVFLFFACLFFIVKTQYGLWIFATIFVLGMARLIGKDF